MRIAGDEPCFETGVLLSGKVNPDDVRRQLSRWTRAGKLMQWRRGLYSLAPPYSKTTAHPFVIANTITPGSYVSGASALAYYGMIPEYTPVTTSVTLSRPSRWASGFIFQHMARPLFFGYTRVEIIKGQFAFLALPEKAVLDMAHLTSGSDRSEWLVQLRLQNLERLSGERLMEFAERAGKPKWDRVARLAAAMALRDNQEFEEI